MINWDDVRQRLDESQGALNRALAVDQQRLEAAYHRRAEQLAARRTEAVSAATLPVLVVSMAAERYAVPLQDVVHVHPSDNCTVVPGGGKHLLGVINVQGEICSVLDLPGILGLPEPAGQRGPGRVLLVRHGQEQATEQVGLRVDCIEGVQRINTDQLMAPREEAGPAARSCLQGITPDRLLLLDVQALFDIQGVVDG